MGIPKGKILIDRNDIIGKRLGKLEVVSHLKYVREITNGGERIRHYYICKCDCGRVKAIRRSQLTSEIVHSCGCARQKKST